MQCLECNCLLTLQVYDYSSNYFGIPLCMPHQKWIKNHESTDQTIALYFALKQRGIQPELEKFDGFKHIDIAIPRAKINIEVDGGHHNYSHRQALADLKRTYHSFQKGYFTLRIPNALIHNHLEDTADHLADMLNVSMDRNRKKYRGFKR